MASNQWEDGAKAAGGGDYFGCNIGETVRVQLVAMFNFVDKVFDDGEAVMCEIPAHNLADVSADGEARTFSLSKRKAQPLLALCGDMVARKVDPFSRAIEVSCVGERHPTKAGARIGKVSAVDLGAAVDFGGVNAFAAGAAAADPTPAAPSNAGVEAAARRAIESAPDADALRDAFAKAWKCTSDAAIRSAFKAAYDGRLAAFEAGDDVPF